MHNLKILNSGNGQANIDKVRNVNFINEVLTNFLFLIIIIRIFTLDSFDLYLKYLINIKIGSYYISPIDILAFILSITLFLLKFTAIFKKKLFIYILILPLTSFSIDLLINKSRLELLPDIIVSYLKVLIPLFASILLGFSAGLSIYLIKYICLIAIIYVGAQHIYFSLFLRESWLHETIKIGSLQFYRSITTCGPRTASSYVLIFLYVIVKQLKRKGNKDISLNILEIIFDIMFFLFILFSFTRGAILIIAIIFINKYFKAGNILIAGEIFIISVLLTSILFYARITSGIGRYGDIERLNQIKTAITSIRDYKEFIVGNGFGLLYKREVHYYEIDQVNFISSQRLNIHNLNILLLREIGFIRLLILYLLIFRVIRWLKKSGNVYAYYTFILSIIIIFNSELILLFSEYNFPFFFSIVSKKIKNE